MDGETTPLAEVRDAFDASLEGGSIRPLISTLHVLLNNPTEIAVLLGMVVTGFFLRALWDAIAFFSDRILRRLLRCIFWALHQAYPWLFQILPDEEADNNVPEHALCIDYVLLTRISWTEACKFSRLTRWGAPLVALLRLCKGNAAVCEAVCGAGGVELLLRTMAMHVSEVRLQRQL